MHERESRETASGNQEDQKPLLFRKIVQVLNVSIGNTKHHPCSRILDQYGAARSLGGW